MYPQLLADLFGTHLSMHCAVCNIKVKKVDLREHLARHIAWQEAQPNGCGYCGQLPKPDGSRCAISLQKGSSSSVWNPVSTCPMFYKYQNRKDAKCTQRIMECPECTKQMNGVRHYIWKYEAQHHWQDRHNCACFVERADFSKPGCPIPAQFEITAAEQYAMTGSRSMPNLIGF